MTGGTPPDLLGDSESLLRAKERLSRAAKVDRPVLILGERGTGKELAAARLHFLSPRWRGPYVTLNCAALSPGLVDSELFGHEAGSFTGAGKRRPGRFELADGGALFLDEISHLTLEAQARILRVVEYGTFQLVGGASERRVDVRVIAATNADLRRLCRQGSFLPDLWDRLAFDVIELPPLRDRPGDVNLLAHWFGARMARELGWDSPPVLSPEALETLEAYDWPGNVRELKNVIERAVYHRGFEGSGAVVAPGDLRLASGLYPLDPLQDPAPLEAPIPGAPPAYAPIAGPSPANAPIAYGASPAYAPIAGPPIAHDAPPAGAASSAPGTRPPLSALPPDGFEAATRRYESSLLEAAMEAAGRHQGRAAELLGLSYHKFRALRRKLARTDRPRPSP